MSDIDKYMLVESLALAKSALSIGEVPVGCFFAINLDSLKAMMSPGKHVNLQHARTFEIGSESVVCIGQGYNDVNRTKNATRHAEMVAIDQVLQFANQNQIDSCIIFSICCLYVTVEPCIMCASALLQLSITRIVFCCPNERFGGLGSVLDLTQTFPRHNLSIVKGYKCEDAIQLLKQFYCNWNSAAPKPVSKSGRNNK